MITPLGDRAIIKKIADENVTDSGIILAESKQKRQVAKGEIVAIDENEHIKVGDKVLFTEEFAIKVGDELIVEIQDLLAIIN